MDDLPLRSTVHEAETFVGGSRAELVSSHYIDSNRERSYEFLDSFIQDDLGILSDFVYPLPIGLTMVGLYDPDLVSTEEESGNESDLCKELRPKVNS